MTTKAVGIDVGYGYTKATNGSGSPIVFPSLISMAEEFAWDAGLSRKGQTIQYGNRSYFVGEMAALHNRGGPERTLSRDRVTTEEAKILFLSALTRLFPSGYVNGGLTVVTGLPIDWLDDKQAFDDWQGEHILRVNGDKKRLQYNVKEVDVAPQAWGTLIREMVASDGKTIKDREIFDADVAIIDIGTLTVNFLSYEQRTYMEEDSASLKIGMIQVLRRLKREILRVHGLDLPLHQVDEALRLWRVKVYGDTVPIHDIANPIIDGITDNIVAQAKSLWDDGITKGRVLLTGGGAIALGKSIKEKYPHKHIGVVHDAQTANVTGLYIRALMKENFGA